MSDKIPPDVYAKFLLTDGMSEEISCNDCVYHYKLNGAGSCTVRLDRHRNNPNKCKDFSM